MNISLIGMSGAGKSAVGRRVAENLNLTFIDVDEVLESHNSQPLSDMLSDLGDDAFIAAESRATIRASTDVDNVLVSTGGSVVYSDAAMRHLRDFTTVVYLRVPTQTLIQRISGDMERTARIVRLAGRTVEKLIGERLPLYEKYAHITVDLDNLDLDKSARIICDRISANG